MKRILLAHGGGGRLSRELIEGEIAPRFKMLGTLPDAAALPPMQGRLLMSTDGFVVQPLEFPGGNIGHLAVHGTCNDLAVSGGRPKWLSLGMVLEEGLPLPTLGRVLDAIVGACEACGVQVVTGDTKVVPHGQCDGIYLTTAGIAEALPELDLRQERIAAHDHVVVSGPIGDHGMAVICAREGFELETAPQSDTGPVFPLVQAAARFGAQVKFMRDPTRGGLAAVLSEVAAPRAVVVREADLPLSGPTRSVAELMGIDLMHVASEGRAIAICAPEVSAALVAAWQDLPQGKRSCVIGEVLPDSGPLLMQTVVGGRRTVEVPRGEILARIC